MKNLTGFRTGYRIVFKVLSVLAFMLFSSALAEAGDKRIVGYVTSWSEDMPNPKSLTNINYAFGHVNNSFDGIRIDNPSRLRDVAALKKRNKNLEVQLSVGGWGSGNFSEMAAGAEKRKAFAKDCKRVIDEFGLDGVDIDWEYPGSSVAGISSSPEDKDNYILLMRDIREAIGADKLLTLASPATVSFYEFKPMMQYVDFVNVMAYDLNRPPSHHSALYRSPLSGDMTADEGIRAHMESGVPASKLVLGVPFYGHGKAGVFPDFIDYDEIKKIKGYRVVFDDVAKVPYVADDNGEMVICYDNPESLAQKCRYVNENGLGGIMFWDYSGDTPDGELLKTIRKNLK
ncbi:MAG: glycoside hydrolase family 18 protein [Muribaculaceae bacterium]